MVSDKGDVLEAASASSDRDAEMLLGVNCMLGDRTCTTTGTAARTVPSCTEVTSNEKTKTAEGGKAVNPGDREAWT